MNSRHNRPTQLYPALFYRAVQVGAIRFGFGSVRLRLRFKIGSGPGFVQFRFGSVPVWLWGSDFVCSDFVFHSASVGIRVRFYLGSTGFRLGSGSVRHRVLFGFGWGPGSVRVRFGWVRVRFGFGFDPAQFCVLWYVFVFVLLSRLWMAYAPGMPGKPLTRQSLTPGTSNTLY